MTYPTERCRTKECNALIIWARTVTGSSMPIDAEPVEGGNVVLEMRQGFVRATVLRKDDVTTEPTYVSHFTTCVRAAGWRTKR